MQLKTRMRSSRMRTSRSLTVSHRILCMPPCNHACPLQPHTPPSNHTCPPATTHATPATMHAPSNHAFPLEPHMPPNHACPWLTMHPPPLGNHAHPLATMHPLGNHARPPGNHARPPHEQNDKQV